MYQNLAIQPVAISHNLLEVKTYITEIVRDVCNFDKGFIIKNMKLTSISIKQTPRAAKISPLSLSKFFSGAVLINPVSFIVRYSAHEPENIF